MFNLLNRWNGINDLWGGVIAEHLSAVLRFSVIAKESSGESRKRQRIIVYLANKAHKAQDLFFSSPVEL